MTAKNWRRIGGEHRAEAMADGRADVCDRCDMLVVQDGRGNWVHAEVADAAFCSLVMRAPERLAEPKRVADELFRRAFGHGP